MRCASPPIPLSVAACVVLAAATVGCDRQPENSDEAPTASEEASVEAALDGVFRYADLEASAEETPAWVDAPLPTNPTEWHEARHLDTSRLAARICGGDTEAADRLLAAVREADDAGTLDEGLKSRYRKVFYQCRRRERHCDWLVETLRSEDSPRVAGFLAPALTTCPGLRGFDVVDRQDLPLDDVLALYLRASGSPALPVHERLVEAVADRARAEDHKQARDAGRALRSLGDRDALEVARRAREQLDDPDARGYVTLVLSGSSIPEAVDLWRQGCSQPALSGEIMCEDRYAEPGNWADKPLAERARSVRFDREAFLEEHPDRRGEVADALQSCVENDRLSRQLRCLESLALVDWQRARSVAAELTEAEWPLSATVRTLRIFESRPAIVDQIREWGLAGPDAAIPERADDPVAFRDVLAAVGGAHSFDMETGRFPNQHDVLLTRLARMAGPPLADVRFDEVPPESDRAPGRRYDGRRGNRQGTYTLRAYADGTLYTVEADNNGDWYDAGTVLGMLNSLARELDTDVRLVSSRSTGQSAYVAIGPPGGLAAARRAGLLEFGNAEDAANRGRSYERRTVEEIREKGLPE